MNEELFRKILNQAWLIKQFNTIKDIVYVNGRWQGCYRERNQEYTVQVLDSSSYLYDSCQCAEWQQFGVCRHTLALRMYKGFSLNFSGMEEKQKAIIQKKASKYTRAFFHSMEKLEQGYKQEIETTTYPLEVAYQLIRIPVQNYMYHTYVQNEFFVIRLLLRQENGKYYQVKDISEFIEAFVMGGTCQITPKIKMYVCNDLFTEEQQQFIRWLIKIQQDAVFVKEKATDAFSRKELLLLPTDLRRLLQQFMRYQQEYIHEYDGRKYKHEPLQYGSSPGETFLTYHLFVDDSDTDFALLENKSRLQRLNEKYCSIIDDHIIHFLSANQMAIYKQLYRFYDEHGNEAVGYTKHTIAEFFSKQLPILSQVAEVKIDEVIKEKVVHYPLEVKFYLRQTTPSIVELEIDYHYGDYCFSKNHQRERLPENEEMIVVHDDTKEHNVRYVLSKLGYINQPMGIYLKELLDDETWYRFFTEEITRLNQFGEVCLDANLEALLLNQEAFTPKLEVIKTGGLLDISFNIDGIGLKDVEKVLVALSKNQSYTRLEDGSLLIFDEQYDEVNQSLQVLRNLSDSKDATFQVPLYRGAQIMALNEQYVDVNQEFEEFVHYLTHPTTFPAHLPKGLHAQLRSYQLNGFRWMKLLSHYQLGGILADEMGLGKTLQTIAYLLSEKEESGRLQALIVVPASLLYNWSQEFQRFAPQLNVQVINGDKVARKAQINVKSDVYITSYQSFRQDEKLYMDQALDVLILDEAQMVKNNQTKTFQALCHLSVPKRFALSGTPMENRLEELWSIFQIALPGYFPNKTKFRRLDTNFIAQMIQPFVMRRTKKEVLLDLPERQEINYYSELTKEQKEIYLAQLEQIRETLIGMDSNEFKKQRISILAGLTRLRQICCSPALYLKDYQGQSGKLLQFKELMIQAMENNRRVLVFSQFASMLTILEEVLKDLGYPIYLLNGSTPSKQRIEMVDSFNNGECSIFLISLKAGGTGLNLTGANTVILYDLWWNPAVEDQATSRAHRIGQKETVEVWRLISEGTIEEKIDALQKKKRELFDQVIQGDEASLGQLSEEDIREIFSVGMTQIE